jgi:hypothetical protein
MDIQRWLNETVDTKRPLKSAPASSSDFFQLPEKARPVFRDKRVRKRTKSDSSLLVPRPHAHTAPKEPGFPSGQGFDESVYSDASRESLAQSESSSQPYARKPRRKTRPERYQPKQHKERGPHVHQSRTNKSKTSRHMSKGKKAEKLDSGVAQTFHAKNVSGDRLTVRAAKHAVICDQADNWAAAEAGKEPGHIQQGKDINSGPRPGS